MRTDRLRIQAPLRLVVLVLLCALAFAVRAEMSLLMSLHTPVSEDEAGALFGDYPFVTQVDAVAAVDGETSLLVVHLSEGTDVQSALAELADDPLVELVQENHSMTLDAQPPGDEVHRQWGLDNEPAEGFESGMHPDADIGAVDAWDQADTDPDAPRVIVAVIDSGVDLDHPDLQDQLVDGIDLVEEDDTDGPRDTDGHGTRVAGIIAAAWNGEGIAGICPQCRIMPVRVTSGSEFDVSRMVEGIRWALSHDADVINISAGTDAWAKSSPLLLRAVQDANDQGVPVVAAAGNAGHRGLDLPAAYPETIAVGSVTRWGERADQSNHAPELDLAAPGVDIRSTVPMADAESDGYAQGSGTSFAAPHLSAILGLMLSGDSNLALDEMRDRLVLAARDTNAQSDGTAAGPDTDLGWGVPNTADALFGQAPAWSPVGVEDLHAEPPQTLSNDAYEARRVRLVWSADPDATSYRIERVDEASGEAVTVGYSAGAPEGADPEAPTGQQSCYRVVSVNANGEDAGEGDCVPGSYVPYRPWPLAASDGSTTDGVIVSWDAVDNADHYRVYRSSSSSGRPSLVGTSTDTELVDSDATPTIVYWYWVSAVTAEGQEGRLSEPDQGHRANASLTAPENLRASTSNSSGILVQWDSVPNAVRYWVYRATSPDGPWDLREYPSSTSWMDTSATAGTSYWYRVRAENSAGLFGPFSEGVSGRRVSSYRRYRIIWIGPGRYIKIWY